MAHRKLKHKKKIDENIRFSAFSHLSNTINNFKVKIFMTQFPFSIKIFDIILQRTKILSKYYVLVLFRLSWNAMKNEHDFLLLGCQMGLPNNNKFHVHFTVFKVERDKVRKSLNIKHVHNQVIVKITL